MPLTLCTYLPGRKRVSPRRRVFLLHFRRQVGIRRHLRGCTILMDDFIPGPPITARRSGRGAALALLEGISLVQAVAVITGNTEEEEEATTVWSPS